MKEFPRKERVKEQKGTNMIMHLLLRALVKIIILD
jgi:hypothetical protein